MWYSVETVVERALGVPFSPDTYHILPQSRNYTWLIPPWYSCDGDAKPGGFLKDTPSTLTWYPSAGIWWSGEIITALEACLAGLCTRGSFVVVVEAEARRRHGVRKRSSLLQRHSPSRLPPPSPSPSPAQLRFSLLQWRARSTFLSAMRIRKGARCVLPMALVDRSCLRMKGFPQREGAPEQPVPEAGVLAAAAAAAAATSHGCSEGLVRDCCFPQVVPVSGASAVTWWPR